MRLFVAIDISEPIRAAMRDYIERLQRAVPNISAKWTRPEGWHLTLKFIGNTEKADEIKDLLSQIAGKPFSLSFRGVGFFTPRSPRVFFVDIQAPPELAKLASQIENEVAKIGIEKEEPDYSPHLTLARFGSGRPDGSRKDRNQAKMYTLKQYLDEHPQLAQPDFGTMTANEFFLYESKLNPKGSVYSKIARYPLAV